MSIEQYSLLILISMDTIHIISTCSFQLSPSLPVPHTETYSKEQHGNTKSNQHKCNRWGLPSITAVTSVVHVCSIVQLCFRRNYAPHDHDNTKCHQAHPQCTESILGAWATGVSVGGWTPVSWTQRLPIVAHSCKISSSLLTNTHLSRKGGPNVEDESRTVT